MLGTEPKENMWKGRRALNWESLKALSRCVSTFSNVVWCGRGWRASHLYKNEDVEYVWNVERCNTTTSVWHLWTLVWCLTWKVNQRKVWQQLVEGGMLLIITRGNERMSENNLNVTCSLYTWINTAVQVNDLPELQLEPNIIVQLKILTDWIDWKWLKLEPVEISNLSTPAAWQG